MARASIRASVRGFQCEQCGTAFETAHKRRFCSPVCRSIVYNRRIGVNTWDEYVADARAKSRHRFKCEHCGKDSYRKLSSTSSAKGYRNRWCSMACRVADKGEARAAREAREEPEVREASPKFSKYYAKYCEKCQVPFGSRGSKAHLCALCQKARNIATAQVKAMQVHRLRACTICCLVCRIWFSPIYPHAGIRLCSQACVDARGQVAAQKHRRIYKARRRAVMKGSDSENVDPIKVFDRDGWKCQMCKRKTPQTKRGSYSDDAPELDHIIPLSKGGSHSYLNCQCACRGCNGGKGATPRGQLLLLG